MSDFDLFKLSDEHEMLREAVRAVCDDKVAPRAAEVDEKGEFPQDSYDALRKADFHAPHIPEEYGGAGADALATCIVIEEVARACASSSLIPAVNKLGTMPLLLSASEDLLKRYLPAVASGEAMFSYALSEPEAGSDAAAMKTRAVRDGDHYVLNGAKRWITNAGVSEYYTVMAVTDPDAGRERHLRLRGREVRRGLQLRRAGEEARHQGLADPRAVLRQLPHPRRPADRRRGHRLQDRAAHAGPHPRHDRGAGGRHRAGALDYATGYAKERKQFGKAIAEFQGIQFMLADMAMKVEAARQLTYVAACKSERGDKDLTFFGAAAKCFASDVAMEVTTDAVQLLGGYGYVKDYPVERMMRDAKITQIYEGTNQVQRVVMARQLLK